MRRRRWEVSSGVMLNSRMMMTLAKRWFMSLVLQLVLRVHHADVTMGLVLLRCRCWYGRR
jgi:hypothetical protein